MKRILSVLLIGIMFVTSVSFNVLADETEIMPMANDSVFAGGTGTQDDPYQVSTPEQLNEVRNYLNKYFIQINDIDMTEATSEGGAYWNDGTGWIPIGTYESPVRGYDGGGFKIIGLNIYESTGVRYGTGGWAQIAGLFGYIGEGSIVENVILTDGEYRITRGADVLVDLRVGGIAAYGNAEYSKIYNCINYNNTHIINESPSTLYIGGISSYQDTNGEISGCYNYGDITVDNNYHANDGPYVFCGGICGQSYGSTSIIRKSTNFGSIDMGTLKRCSIGGISGELQGNMSRCGNCGNITIEEISYYGYRGTSAIGGIAGNVYGLGKNEQYVDDCYNIGDITVSAEDVSYPNTGGLAGETSNHTINRCYNAGQIDGSGAINSDGLVGAIYTGSVFNNYYSVAESPILTTDGVQTNVKNLSNDEMKMKDSFVGFNFDTVWDMSPDKNSGYPYLRNVENMGNTGDDESIYSLGDVNRDGYVDFLDAQLILKFDAGLTDTLE